MLSTTCCLLSSLSTIGVGCFDPSSSQPLMQCCGHRIPLPVPCNSYNHLPAQRLVLVTVPRYSIVKNRYIPDLFELFPAVYEQGKWYASCPIHLLLCMPTARPSGCSSCLSLCSQAVCMRAKRDEKKHHHRNQHFYQRKPPSVIPTLVRLRMNLESFPFYYLTTQVTPDICPIFILVSNNTIQS